MTYSPGKCFLLYADRTRKGIAPPAVRWDGEWTNLRRRATKIVVYPAGIGAVLDVQYCPAGSSQRYGPACSGSKLVIIQAASTAWRPGLSWRMRPRGAGFTARGKTIAFVMHGFHARSAPALGVDGAGRLGALTNPASPHPESKPLPIIYKSILKEKPLGLKLFVQGDD